MIKNDEDYLIRRTYTNYGGSKMSADEMFEELGFKKVIDNDKEIKYQYINVVMGDRIEHTLQIAKIGKIVFSYRNDENHQVMGFGEKELQAINKKCEELRME